MKIISKKICVLILLVSLIIGLIVFTTSNNRFSNKIKSEKLAVNEDMVFTQNTANVVGNIGIIEDTIPIEIGYSTGTAPFDLNNEPGNDSSRTNQIVRSFDSVTYRIATGYRITENVQENIYLYVKSDLPAESQNKLKWNEDVMQQWGNITNNGLSFEGRIQIKDLQDSGIEGKELVVNVLGAENGYTFTPNIYAWISGENTQVSNIDTYKIDNVTETTVSAAPKYNIKLATDGGDMQKRVTVSLNGTQTEGKMFAATASLQLYNDMCIQQDGDPLYKGLKGVEIPNGTITFDLDFSMSKNNAIIEDYSPILWNYKINHTDSEWQIQDNIISELSTFQKFSRREPRGVVSINDRKHSIFDSGTVTINEQIGNKVSVAVNDYKFDGTFPTFTNNDNPISENIGYFSVIYFEVFVPNSEKTSENGIYKLHVKDSNMKVNNQLTQQKDSSDDEINSFSVNSNAGVYNHYIRLHKMINGQFSTKYLSSEYGTGDAVALLNQEFYGVFVIGINENNSEGTEITKVNKFIKFEGDGIQPVLYNTNGDLFGQSDVLISNNVSWTVKYVAKNDGTVWQNENERNNTIISDDNLIQYNTLDELNAAGKVCIGMYFEGTGKINTPVNKLDNYLIIKFVVNSDAIVNNTYGITQDDIYYVDDNPVFTSIQNQYEKTTYNSDGTFKGGHQGLNSLYALGQTVLVTAAKPTVTKTAINGQETEKNTYDLSNNEYEVTFKLQPKLDIENYNGAPIENATVRLIDTLPKGLTYLETITENENLSGPQITNNQDGTTTLVWEISNCVVGQPITDIKYKTQIDIDVEVGAQLLNKVVIECDKAGFTPIENRTASFTINIAGNLSHRLSKKVIESEIQKNEEINYVLEYLNNTNNNVTVRILDILPYNGDGRNTNFNGGYTLKNIEINGVNGLKAYTTNKEEVRQDNNNPLISETNNYEWIEETNLSSINKEVKAIAIQGEVASKAKVTIKFTLKTNGNIENDVYYNNSIANVSGSTIQMQSLITKTIVKDKYGKVTANYYEFGTDKELAQSETSQGKVGENYTTHAKTIEDYDLVKIEGNENGQYEVQDKVVNYYYSKKKGNLIVQYIEKSTGNKLLNDKKSSDEIGKPYETNKEDIEFYKFVESTNNTKGKYKVQDQKVIYYYEKLVFNFALNKEITEVKLNGKSNKLSKVEIDKNEIENTNLEITYKLTVKNTGEIAGICTLLEQIPEGFIIDESCKENWTINDNNLAQLQVEELQPGEERAYEITLKWDNSKAKFGTLANIVKIADFENEAEFEDAISEDNQDVAEFVITVKTGLELNTLGIELVMAAIAVMMISICIKNYYTKIKIK